MHALGILPVWIPLSALVDVHPGNSPAVGLPGCAGLGLPRVPVEHMQPQAACTLPA